MCGIVGYSSQEPFDLDKIRTLIYINAIERGEDATGIYSPINGLKKNSSKGWDFVTDGKVEIEKDTILLAHVRAGTVGNNLDRNAHPFERGNCILIHNGTLKNHWELLRKYKLDFSQYWVDSDVIAGCIDEDDSAFPLTEIDGAAAIIFHDKRQPKKMFVFRNSERPLFRGHIGVSMYISSIEESLKLIGCINIKQFDENKLYTIEDGLIIGNPKPVINIPYKEKPVNIAATIPIDMRCWVGCHVRALHGVTIKDKSKNKFKLVKDRYYEITNIIDLNNVRIWDNTKKEGFCININLFNKDDIIHRGDYVIALEDIKGKYVNNGPILFAKDTIKVVGSVHTDGDIGIDNIPNHLGHVYIIKKYTRKLTSEELAAFLISNNIDNSTDLDTSPFDTSPQITPAQKVMSRIQRTCEYPKKDIPFRVPLSLNIGNQLDIDSNEFAIEESVKDIVRADIRNTKHTLKMSIIDIENDLHDYFLNMDSRLEDIKKKLGNFNDGDAMEELKIAIEENFKVYNEMFKIEEINA